MTEQPSVMVVCACWLRQEHSWLYDQVRDLPDDIEVSIVCWRRDHDVLFALPHVVELDGKSTGVNLVDTLLSAVEDTAALGWAVDSAAARLRVSQRIEFANRLGVDVVHSHFATVGRQDRAVVQATGARHVVSLAQNDLRGLTDVRVDWRDDIRELVDAADLVLVEDEALLETVHDWCGTDADVALEPDSAGLADIYYDLCS